MFEDSSDEEKPTDEAYLTKRLQTLRNQVKANIMTDSLKTIIFEKIFDMADLLVEKFDI